ncbi:DUF885 family protein [Ureaplasma ceti]|uniref:Lipoprotein n=1 Tax=Ureaplasma ceti TaxID=3119530 RepID=A0ABP9U5F6_9BACT
MKKVTKKILFSTFGVLATALTVVPLAVGLSSCSSTAESTDKTTANPTTQANPVLNAYKEYSDQKKELMKNSNYGLVNSDTATKLINLNEKYISMFKKIAGDSESLKLNSDQVVWANSILFNLEQELENYTTHIDWLGGVPTDNAKLYPCDAFSDYVKDNANASITVDKDLTKSIVALNEFKGYLLQLQTNFETGAKNGVAQSIIVQRLFIADLLKNLYSKELAYWANPTHKSPNTDGHITIDEVINGPQDATDYPKTNYLEQNVQTVENSSASQEQKDAYKKAAEAAQTQLNAFLTYFVGTYFAGAIKEGSGYGFGGTTRAFLTQKVEPETERTYVDPLTNNKLYGLGLTAEDLNAKNVGLSWMKNSDVGEKIYTHLLQFSTTSSLSPEQVFQNGVKDTNAGIDNMQALANAVVDLETGHKYVDADAVQGTLKATDSWTTNVKIDTDGVGPNLPQEKQLTFKYLGQKTDSNANEWKQNWLSFNQWLNDEDFFWGREQTGNNVSKFGQADYDILLGAQVPTQDQLNKYGITVEQYTYWKQQLVEKGYWTAWNQDGTYGSYPKKSILCSTFTEYRDYRMLADLYENKYENGHFTKKTHNFKIVPYYYNQRDVAGVGEEGYFGDDSFYLNVDPYNDLQKWSETSFTSHETILGHRTQGSYEILYGAQVNNKKGPAFAFTSYHEGWAVFIEWFENQIGAYGKQVKSSEPNNVNYSSGLPVSFKGEDAQGFVAGDIHGLPAEQIKNFQNGIYWDKANSGTFKLQDNKAGWGVATELGNMLQYYGFLNEAQLRNMRQAVDTAFHGKFSSTDGSLGQGASIADVRNYLHNKSALGVGDISNESIRYLSFPGQAASYMTGKHVMETVYETVNAAYQKEHPGEQIFTNEKVIKKLFDLYLRDGSVPVDTLKDVITEKKMIDYVIGDAPMFPVNRTYTK